MEEIYKKIELMNESERFEYVQRYRRKRIVNGITQVEVAEKFPTYATTISKLENGVANCCGLVFIARYTEIIERLIKEKVNETRISRQ